MPSAGTELWKKCSLGSFRKFKFGSGSLFASKGSVLLNAVVRLASNVVERFVLQIELIDLDIPLLISRRSLSSMSAKIDFSTNVLEIKGGKNLPLQLSPGGHLLLEIRPAKHPLIKSSAFTPVYVQEGVDIDSEEDNEEPIMPREPNRKKEMSMEDILKIHKQLGHASHSSLSPSTSSRASFFRSVDFGCVE